MTNADKPNSQNFNIRDASLNSDHVHFIAQAFDSTLPYLDSIGSGQQWGAIPFSKRSGFNLETQESIEQSEKYQATGSGDGIRVVIAEIEIESTTPDPETPNDLSIRIDESGKRFLAVGAATVREDWLPAYVTKQAENLGIGNIVEDGLKGILYLEVIVTDFRAGEKRKGAGKAMMRWVVEYGRERGKRVVYVDGVGNNRKLINYYERQSFSIVGDFFFKRRNGSTWLGTLLRMDLQLENSGEGTEIET